MYEDQTTKETAKILKTDLTFGISNEEAINRLAKNGKNLLKETQKKTIWKMFLYQLHDPMIYILFTATIISIFLKEISDAIIILMVILLNAVVGTIQEFRAEKALDALKQLSSPNSLVKREGQIKEIKSEDLVLGDILIIEAGRTIGADVRLIETASLKVEEASLTGESVAVEKDSKLIFDKNTPLGDKINLAFMSTNAVYGRGEGIVIATGMDTQVGKIADMIDKEKDELTPLQKRLASLGKLLGFIALGLCLILFVVALIQKRDPIEMFKTAISLAVAAIPEGLPAIVTITLALGVQRIVKVNTIVRRLPSVETLGSVSIVCSDKTGTLTQNKMHVIKIYYSNKLLPIEEAKINESNIMIEGLMLCNDASIEEENIIGDPTEVALIEIGKKFNIEKEILNKLYPRLKEIPFDSKRKMMSTLHKYKKGKRQFTKGALETILEKCKYMVVNDEIIELDEKQIKDIKNKAAEMTKEALRVLSVAYKDDEDFNEENLIFAGLVGMIDPPREEAKQAVLTFKEAGITTVMITGDHIDTAFAIAKQLNIASRKDECISSEELNQLSDKELSEKVKNIKVFARVSPEHKVKIVKAFKANNHIVSMTGDGVNDAPSLKAADIGIAMGITGTDVAKEASDIVLSDDNFASIEKAIEEGRGIYANIKKSILFLLSSNLAEIIVMLLMVILRFPLPLIAIHILWINLVTDTMPALALGSDGKESDIMKNKPRNINESLFANGGGKLTLFYGIFISLLTLIAFLYVPALEIIKTNGFSGINYNSLLTTLENKVILTKAQTYSFSVLALTELFHAIGMRDVKKSIFKSKLSTNKMMIAAVVFGFLLQLMITEIPFFNTFFKTANLNLNDWFILIIISIMVLIAHEFIVIGRNIKLKRYKQKDV